MEKIIFTKDLVANSAVVADQWKHLTIDRKVFCNAEAELAKTYGVNATALVTKDYWRDVDNVTTRVFRNEAGQDMMADLMGIAANINMVRLWQSAALLPMLVRSSAPCLVRNRKIWIKLATITLAM